jgi:hypothetical protein
LGEDHDPGKTKGLVRQIVTMTRASLFIVSLSCLLLSCSGQEKQQGREFFEGQVSYDITFTRKTDKYDSLLLRRIVGNYSDYYYKEGNELNITPGVLTPWGLYRVVDNKAYSIRAGEDTVYWDSWDGPGPKILSSVITPGKEVVLGILCDELKVTFENKTVICYFNRDTLRIDPSLHKTKTLTSDDFYAEQKKALSLKFIIDKPDYTMTYTATKINNNRLSDKLFEVPPGFPIVKSQ